MAKMHFRFPNESPDYREARNALIEEEVALMERVKAVAEQRRKLPRGGALKENYEFSWATSNRLGETVTFEDLFGDKDTLLLYSFMFGPSWDKPCLSCTSIVDGFDRMAYPVSVDAAFVVVGRAAPERINAWANERQWQQIELVSGHTCSYQADYCCQRESDDTQYPMLNVFQKVDGQIFHFWGSEMPTNNIDMVWPYWNLMDLVPAGRPDRANPPQNYRSEFLEQNYDD